MRKLDLNGLSALRVWKSDGHVFSQISAFYQQYYLSCMLYFFAVFPDSMTAVIVLALGFWILQLSIY